MAEKLVVCIMGQNCEKFIGMCLENVKKADAIVFCDGGSTDKTKLILRQNLFRGIKAKNEFKTIIENQYDQEDKGMNGKQRNFYLKYLKENYKDYWALCIDADEVVEDLSKIKEFIQEASEDYLYNFKMRHFIGNLGHEDATQPMHFAPNRLFKIDAQLSYPEAEHPILQGKESAQFAGTTIWHLAYVPNLWDFKEKYENHLKKSNIHTPDFLDNWYKAHLFGQYPSKPINLIEIPEIILKEFGVNKDEFYFQGRGVNINHFIMLRQWLDKFNSNSVLDLGCGLGPYGFALKILNPDIDYEGIEISQWAIDKNPFGLLINQGDIRKNLSRQYYDMVLVLDILEHLEEKDLDTTLKLIKEYGKIYIFSIPFLNDTNLYKDSSHRIFKEKKWWKEKLAKYFKIKEAPEDWLFKEQILIGEPADYVE